MKFKKILYIALIVLICAAALAVLLFGIFDVRLNIKKYHEFSADSLTFSLYGSFGDVNKVKITENGETVVSLQFRAKAQTFEKLDQGNDSFAKTADINSDGYQDLLLLSDIEEDSDKRYLLFLGIASGGFQEASEGELVNFHIKENGAIYSEEHIFTPLASTPDAPFERAVTCTEFRWIDSKLTPYLVHSITYYSANDIYCHSVSRYNESTKALSYVDDDWLSPDQYRAEKNNLSAYFTTFLPE